MKIKNLHQPYIFKRNNKYNLLVSELVEGHFEFVFGGSTIREDKWKLKYVDEYFNITNINTPSNFEFQGETYYVVAECSGFIVDDKISYIIGGHTKKIEDRYIYFFVKGDFDYLNKSISNFQIIDVGVFCAYVNKDKIYGYNNYNNGIYVNGEFLFDTSKIFETTIRIMGIYNNDNEIIVTGINDDYESYILNVNDLTYKKILNKYGDNKIYKSSIIIDGDDKFIAYTDKVFVNHENINECLYYLYYDNEFILE